MRGSLKVISYKTYSYPQNLRRRVLDAVNLKAPDLSRLNFELSEYFASCALRLLRRSPGAVRRSPICVIGSHGQTVYHGPIDRTPNTLQLVSPSVIAERTGLPVVGNFRHRDIAAGGQGAPLIPFFDCFSFGHLAPVVLLNIGGIANVTVITSSPMNITAFDTGPGNCLMDLAVSLRTKGKLTCDKNGALARRGKADETCVAHALDHPYFMLKPPKSIGRELFNEEFLRRYFGALMHGRFENLLATLTLFTVRSVARPLRNRTPGSQVDVIASGGGTKNKFLMKTLADELLPLKLRVCDDYGIPSESKEAAAFALMGWMAYHGMPNHMPSTTGAKGPPRILGEIAFP